MPRAFMKRVHWKISGMGRGLGSWELLLRHPHSIIQHHLRINVPHARTHTHTHTHTHALTHPPHSSIHFHTHLLTHSSRSQNFISSHNLCVSLCFSLSLSCLCLSVCVCLSVCGFCCLAVLSLQPLFHHLHILGASEKH